MKLSVLLLIAYLALSSVSFAQQSTADTPATKEDIEKYLEVMHTRDMMKTMIGAMSKQVHQMVDEQLKKLPGMTPDIQQRAAKLTDDLMKDFPFDEMLDAMIPVYQKHFTKGNIDDLLAFYSTPTGQKLIRELPAITSEAMQAAMPVAQKMMAMTMQRVEDDIAQMQKEIEATPKKQVEQN